MKYESFAKCLVERLSGNRNRLLNIATLNASRSEHAYDYFCQKILEDNPSIVAIQTQKPYHTQSIRLVNGKTVKVPTVKFECFKVTQAALAYRPLAVKLKLMKEFSMGSCIFFEQQIPAQCVEP